MTKKIITIIGISLFCILSVTGQDKREGREKIKALKIAYLTEQLDLTAKEAQKFWPIYNNYDKKQHVLRNTYRTSLRKVVKKNVVTDDITEENAKNLISLKLNTDKKLYEVQKEFLKNIEGVISYKKIIKLQVAEIEFTRHLMRKYKRKRPDSKD